MLKLVTSADGGIVIPRRVHRAHRFVFP